MPYVLGYRPWAAILPRVLMPGAADIHITAHAGCPLSVSPDVQHLPPYWQNKQNMVKK